MLTCSLALALMFTSNSAYAVNLKGHGCLPPSIKSVLKTVERKFGKIHVISSRGKRPRLASGKRSYHESCRAADFYLRGNKRAAISWLKLNWSGGVITYSGRMNHVHIDNGPRYRGHKRK